jgi:hypothetical protein
MILYTKKSDKINNEIIEALEDKSTVSSLVSSLIALSVGMILLETVSKNIDS